MAAPDEYEDDPTPDMGIDYCSWGVINYTNICEDLSPFQPTWTKYDNIIQKSQETYDDNATKVYDDIWGITEAEILSAKIHCDVNNRACIKDPGAVQNVAKAAVQKVAPGAAPAAVQKAVQNVAKAAAPAAGGKPKYVRRKTKN